MMLSADEGMENGQHIKLNRSMINPKGLPFTHNKITLSVTVFANNLIRNSGLTAFHRFRPLVTVALVLFSN